MRLERTGSKTPAGGVNEEVNQMSSSSWRQPKRRGVRAGSARSLVHPPRISGELYPRGGPGGVGRARQAFAVLLSPIRTQSTHGIATATNITGAAVPESDPTEILSPVGAISPRHARLCRPRWLLRPATLAEKRGFSTVTGEFRRETRLSAGGEWIRTSGSAMRSHRQQRGPGRAA